MVQKKYKVENNVFSFFFFFIPNVDLHTSSVSILNINNKKNMRVKNEKNPWKKNFIIKILVIIKKKTIKRYLTRIINDNVYEIIN